MQSIFEEMLKVSADFEQNSEKEKEVKHKIQQISNQINEIDRRIQHDNERPNQNEPSHKKRKQ